MPTGDSVVWLLELFLAVRNRGFQQKAVTSDVTLKVTWPNPAPVLTTDKILGNIFCSSVDIGIKRNITEFVDAVSIKSSIWVAVVIKIWHDLKNVSLQPTESTKLY